MKRTIILSFILAFVSLKVNSQTVVTSRANGNFLNPTTWDCMCIPSTTNIIDIQHNVVLNTNWSVDNATLIIEPTGSLIQDATQRSIQAVNNGYIRVQGTTNFANLYIQSGSTLRHEQNSLSLKALSNYGSIEGYPGMTSQIKTFQNFGLIDHSGTIASVDSFYNANIMFGRKIIAKTFYNADTLMSASITGLDSALNAGFFLIDTLSVGRFSNLGYMEGDGAGLINATNAYNGGFWIINGPINIAQDMTNDGTFYSVNETHITHDFLNRGELIVTGEGNFNIDHDFTNGDTDNHDAKINAVESLVHLNVGHDFLNLDSIYCWSNMMLYMQVQNNSYNAGIIAGTVDFCDATPVQANGSPDVNTGTIANTVTFCASVGIAKNNKKAIGVYPNPASTELMISGVITGTYEIFNNLGQTVSAGTIDKSINVANLPIGAYTVKTNETNTKAANYYRFNVLR